MTDVIKLVVEQGKARILWHSAFVSAKLQLFCPLLEHLLPALFLREPEMSIKERCREGNSTIPIDCFWNSVGEGVKDVYVRRCQRTKQGQCD